MFFLFSRDNISTTKSYFLHLWTIGETAHLRLARRGLGENSMLREVNKDLIVRLLKTGPLSHMAILTIMWFENKRNKTKGIKLTNIKTNTTLVSDLIHAQHRHACRLAGGVKAFLFPVYVTSGLGGWTQGTILVVTWEVRLFVNLPDLSL